MLKVYLANLDITVPVFRHFPETNQVEILVSDIPKAVARRAALSGETVKYWYGENAGGNKLVEDPKQFNFGQAIERLREGKKVARVGWNGKGMHIQLQIPDDNSKMKQPYIYIVPSAEDVIPWVASQRDILSEDWYEVV